MAVLDSHSIADLVTNPGALMPLLNHPPERRTRRAQQRIGEKVRDRVQA
jgi:hypothetical protein